MTAYRDAIALVGVDRLAYFQRVVPTIAQNKNLEDFDLFVFLDRSLDKKADDVMRAHVQVVKKHLPNATLICREENWGCGKNIIDVRRELFDRRGYDKVFIVEDDMLLSKTYFSYCMNLLRWGRERYGNIGAVQGWYRCFMPEVEKKKHLHEVRATFISNWWGYLITHECWNEIRKSIYEFEKKHLDCNYWERDHKKIIEWFSANYSHTKVKPCGFPVDTEWFKAREKVIKSPPTGQDAVTSLAMHNAGYVRLAPTVNRGQYIGEIGIHMRPAWFRRERYDEVILHEFDDAKLNHAPYEDHMEYKEQELFSEGIRKVSI